MCGPCSEGRRYCVDCVQYQKERGRVKNFADPVNRNVKALLHLRPKQQLPRRMATGRVPQYISGTEWIPLPRIFNVVSSGRVRSTCLGLSFHQLVVNYFSWAPVYPLRPWHTTKRENYHNGQEQDGSFAVLGGPISEAAVKYDCRRCSYHPIFLEVDRWSDAELLCKSGCKGGLRRDGAGSRICVTDIVIRFV